MYRKCHISTKQIWLHHHGASVKHPDGDQLYSGCWGSAPLSTGAEFPPSIIFLTLDFNIKSVSLRDAKDLFLLATLGTKVNKRVNKCVWALLGWFKMVWFGRMVSGWFGFVVYFTEK